MKEALLILLGALISCGTTWLLDWLKFGREEKVYIKRRREETYLILLEYITYINAVRKTMIEKHWFPDEDRVKYNNVLVKCKLYAIEKIAKDFYQFMETIINDINNGQYTDTKEMYDNLFKEVRTNLGIKD